MNISVLNKSSQVPADAFTAMMGAWQIWLTRDVAPVWGMLAPKLLNVEGGDITTFIVDKSTDADAYGYHTEDKLGAQTGFVFVDPILADKGSLITGALSVSAVGAHELGEAFIDPACNRYANGVAMEIGDPVQNDAYSIGLIFVSNFATPNYFDSGGKPKFDFMGKLTAPFSVSPGGYQIKLQNGVPTRTASDGSPAWRGVHPSSRTARRLAG